MKAKELYKILSKTFDIKTPTDDWQIKNTKYVTRAFKNGKDKEMGVMLDNSKTIEKVFTATFLCDSIIEKLRRENIFNALIIVHHAKDWDMANLKDGGELFTELSESSYLFLKQNSISVYVAHLPLDNNKSEININKSLAAAMGLEVIEHHLIEYSGISLGLICRFDGTVYDLQKKLEKTIGHKSFLIKNDADTIKHSLVAIVGGGGNDLDIYKELSHKGINTYITGVVNIEMDYPPTLDASQYAKENKINVLAGTHYSTEKFALIDLVDYFKKLGLHSEFLAQEPKFTDYTYRT